MDFDKQIRKDLLNEDSYPSHHDMPLNSNADLDSQQLTAYYEAAWIQFLNQHKPPFFKSCHCCNHLATHYYRNNINPYFEMCSHQPDEKLCMFPGCQIRCQQIHCHLCYNEHQKHKQSMNIKYRDIPFHRHSHNLEQIRKKQFYQDHHIHSKHHHKYKQEKCSQCHQIIHQRKEELEVQSESGEDFGKCQNCQTEIEAKYEENSQRQQDSYMNDFQQESKIVRNYNKHQERAHKIISEQERINKSQSNNQKNIIYKRAVREAHQRIEENNSQINQNRVLNLQNVSNIQKPVEPQPNIQQPFGGGTSVCNCTKSRCLKMYCDCFAVGLVCGKDCRCRNCLNQLESATRRDALDDQLQKNINSFQPKMYILEQDKELAKGKGCRCYKSNCQKKYCECFRQGIDCTADCRCDGCYNKKQIQIVLDDEGVRSQVVDKRAMSISEGEQQQINKLEQQMKKERQLDEDYEIVEIQEDQQNQNLKSIS